MLQRSIKSDQNLLIKIKANSYFDNYKLPFLIFNFSFLIFNRFTPSSFYTNLLMHL
jgi:hypothetical protein